MPTLFEQMLSPCKISSFNELQSFAQRRHPSSLNNLVNQKSFAFWLSTPNNPITIQLSSCSSFPLYSDIIQRRRSIIIQMFSLGVWKKYLFRVIKIVTLVFLCHQVLNAKLLGKQPKHLQTFYIINNFLCITAGAVNMFLYHPNLMGDKKRAWVTFHHLKFVTAIILFTPIVTLLPLSKKTRINLQFYWILASMILAPMARYYREHSMMRQRERKEKGSSE